MGTGGPKQPRPTAAHSSWGLCSGVLGGPLQLYFQYCTYTNDTIIALLAQCISLPTALGMTIGVVIAPIRQPRWAALSLPNLPPLL